MGTVATGIPFDTLSHPWTVGKLINAPDAMPGKGYSIKVRLQGEPTSAFSKGTFSIKSAIQMKEQLPKFEQKKPVISEFHLVVPVSEPHAGAIWQRTADHKIVWNKSGISGYAKVKIRLLRASDDHVVATLGTTPPPNTGHYWWHVSSVLPLQNYRIEVSTPDGKVSGKSKIFSLAADAPPRVNESFYPQISNVRARHWPNQCPGINPTSPGRVPGSLEARTGHASVEWHGECSGALTDYYRAQVYFDISNIFGKVQKATLSMRRKEHIMQSPQGTLATNTECTCRTDLYILNAAWSTNQPPFNFYPGDLWKSVSLFNDEEEVKLDITAIVKDWHQGNRPNHGIMLRNPLESSHYVGSICLTYFDRFNLVVEYTKN